MALLLYCQGISVKAQTERPVPENIIEDALWTYRLLIFCSAGPNERSYFFRDLLPLNWDGFYERDIVFIHIDKWAADAFLSYNSSFDNADRFHINVEREAKEILALAKCDLYVNSVALIGKDGGLKKIWLTQPSEQDIFDIIDAMPMRRQEMRRAQAGQ